MKRVFRVATVFTGAAACAGVLTPAAQAAAVAPGATTRVTPAVTVNECSKLYVGSVYENTLELEYTAGHAPVCFQGSGYWPVGTNAHFRAYCADSKSGSLEIGGVWHPFTWGTHNLYGQVVSAVSVHAGQGGHPC